MIGQKNHLEQALILYSQEGDTHLIACTQRDYAKVLILLGEHEQAIELLRTSLITFQELGLTHERTKTQNILETLGAAFSVTIDNK